MFSLTKLRDFKSGVALNIDFLGCLNSEIARNHKISNISIIIDSFYLNYEKKAEAEVNSLFSLPAYNLNDNDLLFGIEKKEYKNFYKNRVANKSGKGRSIYDKIINLSPTNCPYCCSSPANTIDHYLPSSKYPQYSIFSSNLVPCCQDCNKIKKEWYAKSYEEQIIHPYFDHHILNYTWLHAKIIDAPNNPSVIFFAKIPNSLENLEISSKNLKRFETHLDKLGLKNKFEKIAAVEINYLREFFRNDTRDDIVAHLKKLMSSCIRIYKNSWRYALYDALINSDWYLNGGHQHL